MGPLLGLRVIDLTDDLGRFATKLLAEMGATVVRVHDGEGITHGPAMVDPAAAARGGLVDWWYEAGKRLVPLALDTAAGADAYRRLAAGADLVVETLPPGRLAALGLDHADLIGTNPRLVQVSLTPFGRTGPRSGWVTTDLVTAAMSGVLSVSGTPDRAVVPWGRQSFAAASIIAALTGLAAVRGARSTGVGQLVDVSAQEAVAVSVEQLWFQYHYDDLQPWDKIAPRQGSLHWSRGYLVLPCRTGACMITPTPAPQALLDWLIEEGMEEAAAIVAPGEELSTGHLPAIVAVAAKFALRHDARWLFDEAQKRHLAWGQVQTVRDLEANEQLAFRGAFVSSTDVASVRRGRYPIVFTGTPTGAPGAPTPTALDEVLADWAPRPAVAPTRPATAKPLDGVRVLDFSWVLAGPFGCRMLGDLGADVVKLQTLTRPLSGVNDPQQGFFAVYNRSKRSVALDMKAPGALEVMRTLVEHADVVIENYAAGVLARWGLTWEQMKAWNPKLVYVTMSGCGHEGPWNKVVSFGPTVQALCGLTALSNPPGRGDVGAGYALNDMAAGGLAAVSVVAALEARERTGEGQFVDIAQLEVGAYLVGAAVLDALSNGRVAEPTGNHDPYAAFVVNEVFATADGELAVTVRDDADAAAAATVIGGDLDGLAAWCAGRTGAEAMTALQAAGVPAGRVQNAHHMMTDDEHLAARGFFQTFDSPVFGTRTWERFPAHFGVSVIEPYAIPFTFVGEHAFEVLGGECGMSDDEITAAMAAGILT
jgi:crotonobetainyl-CoA:carnitine CoA-transferase CaiB-like acyl-CoA transferase